MRVEMLLTGHILVTIQRTRDVCPVGEDCEVQWSRGPKTLDERDGAVHDHTSLITRIGSDHNLGGIELLCERRDALDV